MLVFVCMSCASMTQAQTTSQLSEQSSYVNRIIKRQGVHDADPNVYVYTAEFAKRFQMPEEWVSNELKGVDAVAFRVVPRPYRTCGWGGDPKACSSNEVRCEMDLYFDHKRNPLPWDEQRPARFSGHYNVSVNFLWDGQRNLAYQRLEAPKRKDDHVFASDSPFVDPKSGKGLWWQGGYWNANNDRGSIFMSLSSYDREIFSGVSLMVMGGGCGKPADAIWLTGNNAGYQEKNTAYKQISLPQSWRIRVNQATKESEDRAAAFFKQEGEKAMKSLRDSPVPNKSIVPLQ